MLRLIEIMCLITSALAFNSALMRPITAVRPCTLPPQQLFGGGGSKEKEKKGGMGSMMDQFKMVQEIAKKQKKIQEDLGAMRITGVAGDVMVTVNGLSSPVSVQIGQATFEAGQEAVGTALTEALVDADTKAKVSMQEAMAELYKGLDPSALSGLLGGA